MFRVIIFLATIYSANLFSQSNLSPAQNAGASSIEFVYVEGGTFQMGRNDSSVDERPVHNVTVNSFYIGKYEITQKQWRDVMGTSPSKFIGDNLPVENVSWNDAHEFITKLNTQERSDVYRLPTEAEWEYAARGGNKSKGYKYSGSNAIDFVAWYSSNSGNETHEVGTQQPNELGIYDMTGNVWEWCQDWYGEKYYNDSPGQNPKGPSIGTYRVLLGGSWNDIAIDCRVAVRNACFPDYRFSFNGFRLLKSK